MREIKFRAWHNGLERMFTCASMLYLDDFWKQVLSDPDAHVVMEYTGIKDREGKEIYEGDIVQYKEDDTIINAPITFSEGCFWWGIQELFILDTEDSYTVIGNIYQNPELLED